MECSRCTIIHDDDDDDDGDDKHHHRLRIRILRILKILTIREFFRVLKCQQIFKIKFVQLTLFTKSTLQV